MADERGPLQPVLENRWRHRIVGVFTLLLELARHLFGRFFKRFYDVDAHHERRARLARQLMLLEGGPAGKISTVLDGRHHSTAKRKVKIIVNPISGRGRGLRAIPHLRNGLRELGYDVEVVVTERAGQGRQECYALESNVKAVVAVGGDGTLNEVVNGVGDQGVPIAVYSTGTANCIGTEFRIPRNPELFCRMIEEGYSLKLDVADAVGLRRFHSFASLGFDAQVVEELSKDRTGAILMTSYAKPIWRALRKYKWPSVKVEIDGRQVCASAKMVIVSNIRNYAIMEAAPAALATDGLLDVLIFEKGGWLNLARYAIGAFTRSHTNDSDVKYYQGCEVRLESLATDVPLQVDGDCGGHLPIVLRVIPRAVPFLVPLRVYRELSPEFKATRKQRSARSPHAREQQQQRRGG